MHICFISYEYPPDTGIGGIATYVQQIGRLLASKGIYVKVICGSPDKNVTTQENEFISITKIKCHDTSEFRTYSPGIAAECHTARPFDMIEVPEYGAEGLYIKDKMPDIPLIIKLHTPRYLIKELNDYYYDRSFFRKLKKTAGLGYKLSKDLEYKAIGFADHILSPSLSLRNIVADKWNIQKEKIIHAPNPYFPSPALLDIHSNGSAKTILYMGRLETRKGVFNLARAISKVVKAVPDAKFIFLGRDSRGPMRERSMKEVMLKEMGIASANTTFIDHVPLTEIPGFLAQAGICVFPSLWENFPNVCLEAMSAARAVVASKEGGMKEMLEGINGSVLIDPHDVQSIADGIIEMIQNNDVRLQTGLQNREKVTSYYSGKLLDELLNIYRSFLR